MNENAIRHALLAEIERKLGRLRSSRSESEEAEVEPPVTLREDGFYSWRTSCGVFTLGFDPDAAADMSLAER